MYLMADDSNQRHHLGAGLFCKLCDPASVQKGKLCGKMRQILPNYAVIMRRILVNYAVIMRRILVNYAANYYFHCCLELAIYTAEYSCGTRTHVKWHRTKDQIQLGCEALLHCCTIAGDVMTPHFRL